MLSLFVLIFQLGTDISAPKSTISLLLQNLCGQKDQITLSIFIFSHSFYSSVLSPHFLSQKPLAPFLKNGSSALWRVVNNVQLRMREVEGCGATWVAFDAGETRNLAGLLSQLTPMAVRACVGSVESGATRNGSL